MRWLVALALLALPLAGCTGPAGNPNLRPPCAASSPVSIGIATGQDRFRPNELMNVTLTLENSGGRAEVVRYRSWELTMRAYDGHLLRTWLRDVGPDEQTLNKSVPADGRVVLQERWQPWRVTAQLFDPLPQGTYYLCAVLTGPTGENIASGALPFIADPPANALG